MSRAKRSFAFISGSASFSNSKRAPLPLVDILKVSDEELPLLTGTTDCAEGTAQLAQNGIRLIFVTLGANSVFYRFGDKTGHVAGAPCKVGDTFFGGGSVHALQGGAGHPDCGQAGRHSGLCQ